MNIPKDGERETERERDGHCVALGECKFTSRSASWNIFQFNTARGCIRNENHMLHLQITGSKL